MTSSPSQLLPSPVTFHHVFPPVPSETTMHMLDTITYKVKLNIPAACNIDPLNDIQVEAWSNQYDQWCNTGDWHTIPIPHMGDDEDPDASGIHLYAMTVFITSDSPFQFTFRFRVPKLSDEWIWSHGYEENGCVNVLPARDYDVWTQGPCVDHILESVYCGNFLTAKNAKSCGFTHVLNVAHNLDMEYGDKDEIVYRKVGMIGMHDGAHNVIPDHFIKEAVDWLIMYNKPGNKILVHCKKGVGRAGSTSIAFVFAKNPTWNFEEAKEYVLERRWVYPHKKLDSTLYRLYPRDCISQ